MTIKFFPLFFKNEVDLSPLHVNAIYVCTYPLMMFWAWMCQKISVQIGRAQMILLSAAFGLTLLFLMGWQKEWWTSKWIIIPIYIFRTAFMNATKGIRKSVLIDYVKKG